MKEFLQFILIFCSVLAFLILLCIWIFTDLIQEANTNELIMAVLVIIITFILGLDNS